MTDPIQALAERMGWDRWYLNDDGPIYVDPFERFMFCRGTLTSAGAFEVLVWMMLSYGAELSEPNDEVGWCVAMINQGFYYADDPHTAVLEAALAVIGEG